MIKTNDSEWRFAQAQVQVMHAMLAHAQRT
jgi:hypothetical protein